MLDNPECENSDLFIFIDGPRNTEEKVKTDSVKNVAESVSGFKNISINVSNKNKGLGQSIISGVSEIINKYGYAIILEDDLILQPNFMAFIIEGLEKYKNDKQVFSICGYTNKVKCPKDYAFDAYFCTRSSSWGWATWKDRWDSIDWELSEWDKYLAYKNNFNRWGGSDSFGMLEGWKNGVNKSWAIRFCFSQFLQNKLSLFPVKSLVQNDGFDGYGTNCKKWSRFKYELMNPMIRNFTMPEDIEMLNHFHKDALKYHSIPRRLYSKLMYMIYK